MKTTKEGFSYFIDGEKIKDFDTWEKKTNKLEDVIGINIPTSEIVIVSKFIPELFKGFKEKEESKIIPTQPEKPKRSRKTKLTKIFPKL